MSFRFSDTVRMVILVAGLLLSDGSQASGQQQQNSASGAARPNIVVILIDDLRYDTFSFMQHPFLETPEIDALAASGLHFRNAFVTTSLCSPARASFLTGQYMHNHRVVNNADPMPAAMAVFPQQLQQTGYRTAFVGKWHMGGASDAPRPGFDHWVSFRGQGTYAPDGQSLNVNGSQVPRSKYMTDELTDYAVDWLSDQTTAQPFLLYLCHKGVHGLYDPAKRHLDRYQDQDVPLPDSAADTQKNRSNLPMWVQDQRNSWHGIEFPYHGRSGQSLAEMYRHYCEMILSIDDSVGQLRQTLREQGLDRDTLVIFTSDGGHLWGEHGLIDKRCAYEESMRIPLLVSCPSLIPAGIHSDALVTNLDVAPTLLELAGADLPDSLDGHSWVPLFDGSAAPENWRQQVLYEYYWEPAFPQTPTTFALRTDRYKLITYHGIWDTDELYDLVRDPRETRNLIQEPDQQQRIAQLRQQLHAALRDSGGLQIPLGFKPNHGSNQRRATGSSRAEFPDWFLKHPESDRP